MKSLKVSALLLIALFSFTLYASAQVRLASDQIPDEVRNAEIRSIDGSSSVRFGLRDRKITVLVLWASRCLPCRLALIDLNSVYKNFFYRGVDLIGITTEEPTNARNVLRSYLDTSKIDFKLGWLDEIKGKGLLNDRPVLPQILFIAPDGTVVRRFVGWHPRKSGPEIRYALTNELNKQMAK